MRPGNDVVIVRGEFNPKKVFQLLADILGDRYGMEVTVTDVIRKEDLKEEAG